MRVLLWIRGGLDVVMLSRLKNADAEYFIVRLRDCNLGVTRLGRWKIDMEFCVFFCDVQQNPRALT
jgi:hypothetical protein